MRLDKAEQIRQVQRRYCQLWNQPISIWKRGENLILLSRDRDLEITTFGDIAVIRADEYIMGWAWRYLRRPQPAEILDGDFLYTIEARLRAAGTCFGGEHVQYLRTQPPLPVDAPAGFTYRMLEQAEIRRQLYGDPRWENALNYQCDRYAYAAFHQDLPVAVAAADDLFDPEIHQIGIDTLPAFRRRGLAQYLVTTLAAEVERRGAIPYYTTWSSNIASTHVALNAGFRPAWVRYFSEDDKEEE